MAADYTGTRQPQTSQGNPALLHKLLGVGLVIMAVAMVIARHAVGDSPDGSNLPAYAIAGVSAVMLGAALMFLKPLVPRRRAGQTVDRGQRIGRVGSSGWSSGPHLMLEVWIGSPWESGSYRVNPLRYY